MDMLANSKEELSRLMERKWFYILENKMPVNCDFWEYEKADKTGWQMKRTEPVPGIEVSTAFLGINLDWRSKKPICFETMIFGGKYDKCIVRNTDYDAALEDHEAVCQKLKSEFWKK